MKLLRELYLIPIFLYKALLSPFMGRSCGYTPSCSSYAIEAIRKHGIARGTIMGAMRIGRCNSRFFAGFDPVPDSFDMKELKNEYIIRRKPKGFNKLVPPNC